MSGRPSRGKARTRLSNRARGKANNRARGRAGPATGPGPTTGPGAGPATRQGRAGTGGRAARPASRPTSGGRRGRRGGPENSPAGPAGPGAPVTGEGFRQWSDRMRDVEELLDEPELRGEAARIRDRVRGRARNSSATPRSPTGTSSRRSWPTRSASSASGSPRRSAAASRPTPWCRSIATPSRRNMPRGSGAITSDWGAVNDGDLDHPRVARLDDLRARRGGHRGGRAPLELRTPPARPGA